MMSDSDPRDQIVRLEARIEQLAETLENCRKFILVGRVAVACGLIVLAAMLFGAIRFEPTWLAAAGAAVLGGIVVAGANGSTATEAASDLAAAEAERVALIEQIDLHVVGGDAT